jgi:hypothetical protein
MGWDEEGNHFYTICIKENANREAILIKSDNLFPKNATIGIEKKDIKQNLLHTNNHVDVMFCYKRIN